MSRSRRADYASGASSVGRARGRRRWRGLVARPFFVAVVLALATGLMLTATHLFGSAASEGTVAKSVGGQLPVGGGGGRGRGADLKEGAVSPSRASVYAYDRFGMLSPAVRDDPALVYVPNSESNTVDVIDQRSLRIIGRYPVGVVPQHVTPSYDLKTLYVDNSNANTLTPFDPATGKPEGASIPVADPYNLYFTPDGRYAIVVAERLHRLDFRDPHTFRLRHSLRVPCAGIDHMDFSGDGSYAIASCEFSSQLLKIDIPRQRVVAALVVDRGRGSPQDVKVAPDGALFYVADRYANGLWEIDGQSFRVVGFLHTGVGVHGLYPSRDGSLLYASNRGAGSVSVISFRTRRIIATWQIPGGGSPDMGGVSADGKTLWLSGRYNGVVYAFSTRTGRMRARIPVGASPHGLSVWPQPGRYSLGHTGLLR